MRKPFLILIDGPMGSGKTTVAKMLHEQLKDTAHIGVDHIKRFISGFRTKPALNDISKNVVVSMTEKYLANGISVIVEQAMTAKEVDVFKRLAKKRGVVCLISQLEAPPESLTARVHQRTKLLEKPTVPQAHIDKSHRTHTKNKYAKAVVFNSETMNAAQIAQAILTALARHKK
jgi:predicted kinase